MHYRDSCHRGHLVLSRLLNYTLSSVQPHLRLSQQRYLELLPRVYPFVSVTSARPIASRACLFPVLPSVVPTREITLAVDLHAYACRRAPRLACRDNVGARWNAPLLPSPLLTQDFAPRLVLYVPASCLVLSPSEVQQRVHDSQRAPHWLVELLSYVLRPGSLRWSSRSSFPFYAMLCYRVDVFMECGLGVTQHVMMGFSRRDTRTRVQTRGSLLLSLCSCSDFRLQSLAEQ